MSQNSIVTGAHALAHRQAHESAHKRRVPPSAHALAKIDGNWYSCAREKYCLSGVSTVNLAPGGDSLQSADLLNASMSISVVTGAAGFVGQAVVRRLLAAGDEVRALALPKDPCLSELHALGSPDQLRIIEVDVTDAIGTDAAFAGATRAFHTAALVHTWAPWEKFRAVNVGGTQNVARACLAHGVRLLAVSTSDVFGIPEADEVMDEASPVKRWNEPYADTKIEAEQWLWSFRRDTQLPLSIIYPGWVYGPGDKAFFPNLAQAIDDGFMMFWARDAKLPWVFIDNLVDACVLASTHPKAIGQGYIVHDEADGPTLEEVCARIAAAIGKKPPTLQVPYALAFVAAKATQTLWRWLGIKSTPPLLTVDIKAFGFQWHLSAQKIRRQLGWAPQVCTERGMELALRYLAEQRAPCAKRSAIQ